MLKEKIEEEIKYQNTPAVNVFIQKADVDDNGTLYPSGNGVSAKVGIESFKISYTASSSYYFCYWQALDKESNILDSAVVKFDDPAKAVTSVTVYTEAEVIIQAVTSPVPKAVVSFKKNFDAAGSVVSEDKNTFMMDEEFSFSFEPAEEYQFIKWQASNNSVEIKNPESISSKAVAKADGAVTITAICALRPQVGIGNTYPTQTDSICKDTSIIINFDRPLSCDEAELSNIVLTAGGNQLFYGEEEAFGKPYYYESDGVTDASRVIIPAHPKYAVDVPAGKTVVIRVILPDSLYSIDQESGTKIYLCPEGKNYSWSYKINENTNDKLSISVNSEGSIGTLTGKSGDYDIGKAIEYTFKPDENSLFRDWIVSSVPSDAVIVTKSSDNGVEKISLYVESAGTLEIKAATVEKLTVVDFSPASPLEGVAKNSNIVIRFNKPFSNTDTNVLEKISIRMDGVDVKDCFLKPDVSDSNKTITFIANKSKFLPIERGTKIVTVTIPSDFYYEAKDTFNVHLEECTKSYVVNATTKEKAVININTTVGTLSPSGLYEYYIDNTFEVLYKPATGYKFNGWIIEKGSSSAELIKIEKSDEYYVRFYEDDSKSVYRDCLKVSMTENANQYKAVFTVLEEISGCSVRPSFSLVPGVTGFQPYYTFAGTDYDSNIVIEFNKSMNPANFEGFYSEIDESTKDYAVSITSKTGINLSGFFYPPVGSENNKKWTIRPDVTKLKTLLETDSNYDIFVTVRSVAQDSTEDALTLEYDYEKSYRINTGHEQAAPAFENFTFASFRENLVSQIYCSDKDFSEWKDEKTAEYKYGDFSKNHVNNALSFKFNVSELGTGLEKLVISETRVRSVTAETVSEKAEDTVIDLSSKGNAEDFDFDYTFKSENDGVIEIKFTCFDKVGNSSVKKVYAIRDTVYNSAITLRNDENFVMENDYYKSYFNGNIEINKDRICNVYISHLKSHEYLYDVFYDNYKSELDDLDASIEYWNTNGERFNAQPLLNSDKTFWEAKLDKEHLDFDRNIYLKATAKDEAGNEIVIDGVIPCCTDLYVYEENSSFKVYAQIDEGKSISGFSTYFENSDKGEYDSLWKKNYEKNTDYYVECYNSFNSSRLYGLVKHLKITDQTISGIPEIKTPNYEVSIVQGDVSSGTFTATVTLLEDIDADATYYYGYNYIYPSSNHGSPAIEKYTIADINSENRSFTFTVPYDCTKSSTEYYKLFMKLKVEKRGYSVIEASTTSWEVEGDRAPPKITAKCEDQNSAINRGNNSLTVTIEEDSGFKTDSDGYAVMEYALTPISDTITLVNQIEELTEAEWNSKNLYTVKFKPSEDSRYNYVEIPYAVFQPDITYRIDVKVEDSFGNAKVTKTAVFVNTSQSDFLQAECKRIIVDGEPKINLKTQYSGFGWVFNGSVMVKDFYTYYSSNRKITTDETFYCICINNKDWNLMTASDPYYFLCSENRESSLKDLIEGVNGATVMCDNKTLLFTAYSKYDLGTDFQKWNRCASKTGFTQVDKFTTYKPDTASIPDGFYYCTIAAFADGDYAMTTAKIK